MFLPLGQDTISGLNRAVYFFCLKSGYMLYLEAARGPGLVADVSPIRMSKESVTVHLLFLATQTDIMYFQLTKAKWTNEVLSKFSLPRS